MISKFPLFRFRSLAILAILSLFLLFFHRGVLEARTIPAALKPLSDEAGALDLKSKEAIRKICYDLQQETGAEINVLIVRTTSGENHHDFTLRTFNSWGIGQAGVNNGMLIMFALDDRRVEIVPGTRYISFFDEPTCTKLLTDNVVPKMKAGKTAEGVIAATNEVASRIRGIEKSGKAGPKPMKGKIQTKTMKAEKGGSTSLPFTSASPGVPSSSPSPTSSSSSSGTKWLPKAGSIVFFALLGVWISIGVVYFFLAFTTGALIVPFWLMGAILLLGGLGLAFMGFHTLNVDKSLPDQVGTGAGVVSALVFAFLGTHICPRCNKYMEVWDRTITSATYYSSGLGERTQHCDHCGYHNVYTFTISQKRRHSSSSSSSRSSSRSSGGRSSGGGGGASW